MREGEGGREGGREGETTHLRSQREVVIFQLFAIVFKFIPDSNFKILTLDVISHLALPWASYPLNPRPAALLMQSARVHIK